MAGFPGCCSMYEECSDALQCINPDVEFAKICAYKKNLMSGRIFYGKNANIRTIKSIPDEKESNKEYLQEDTELYLYCYGAFFSIRHRQKNGFSYSLSPEHKEKIVQLFQEKEIPYRNKYNFYECDAHPDNEADGEPANSRVVIILDNKEEFNILQNNYLLIPYCYAQKIVIAFKNKGIAARIDRIGALTRSMDEQSFTPSRARDKPVQQKENRENNMKKAAPEEFRGTASWKQLSVWDII